MPPLLSFVALLLLLGACSARSGAPSPAGSGGIGTIEHDGRTRSYLLRVPARVAQRSPVPLVLVLHGGGGNGSNAERMTGFTEKADTEGFIVVYPEGTSRGLLSLLTWNAGHCCGYAMNESVDDVGFLAALIDHISARYPIDPRRVYVTGMSNGAMMAHRAGREISDRIAAIAPVVGGLFGDESAAGGVSAIVFNGMLDRSVPYEGGAPGGPFAGAWDGTQLRPAIFQATFWANANGCEPNPSIEDSARRVHIRFACPPAFAVELHALKDGGHAWPGGRPGSAVGDVPSTTLNATNLIWSFFSSHPKR